MNSESVMVVAGTRESWLTRFHEAFRNYFLTKTGIALPDGIRFSCGWPYNRRPPRKQHRKIIGQTWPKELSRDGTFEIFVSPLVEDALQVAAVAAHELCHIAAGCQYGHGPEFKKVAVALGLTGRMTATVAGEELAGAFKRLVDEQLGPYPHAKLDDSRFTEVTPGNQKTQKTRLVKVVCDRKSCGYALWTTRMWLDLGTPTCACGSTMSDMARRW